MKSYLCLWDCNVYRHDAPLCLIERHKPRSVLKRTNKGVHVESVVKFFVCFGLAKLVPRLEQ